MSKNDTEPVSVPGSYGLPVIGMIADTMDFLFVSGWKTFFLKRQERYASTVFKINLFQKTIAILDHEGMGSILDWDGRLAKDYGFGWAVPPLPLVGSVVPSVFQPANQHDDYKALYAQILKAQASDMESVFDKVFSEHAARWCARGSFDWAQELERFWVDFVFEWYFGARPDTDDVRYVYLNIFTHQLGAITKFLPWSRYRRSIPKFERLLAFVKDSPRFADHVQLAAERGLTDKDALAKQLLFLTGMNNFLGLQGMSKALIGELALRPELRERLAGEWEAQSSESSKCRLTELSNLEHLDAVLKEVFRLHPPVFFIYGRAVKDFNLTAKTGVYFISEGDHLMGAIPLAHLDPDVFDDPQEFMPERYKNSSATSHLIWPHGQHDETVTPHSHICPGKDVAVLLGKLFARELITDYRWQLRERPTWSDTKFHLNVASPVGNMPVQFQRRTKQ